MGVPGVAEPQERLRDQFWDQADLAEGRRTAGFVICDTSPAALLLQRCPSATQDAGRV